MNKEQLEAEMLDSIKEELMGQKPTKAGTALAIIASFFLASAVLYSAIRFIGQWPLAAISLFVLISSLFTYIHILFKKEWDEKEKSINESAKFTWIDEKGE